MSTPAGWYPDPSAPDVPHGGAPAQLRWWDGGRWTEHVHRSAATGAPQHQNPYAPPQRNPYGASQPYPPSQYPVPGVKAIATPDGQALGGLGLRLLARVIDLVLTTLIAVAAGWSSLNTMSTLYTNTLDEVARNGDTSAVWGLLENSAFTQASQTWTFVLLAVSAVYTILTVKFLGGTPGKLICRLRVRDWERPGLPSWGQAIVRWLGSDLLGQLLVFWYLIDFLWPCWDQRRQALHDKMGRTVVVKR
jgi:uncharacterized RDD family membrane protein YckC